MPEWLTASEHDIDGISVAAYGAQLAVALLFGGAIALIYRHAHGRKDGEMAMFTTTLILLTALIAMVTIVIGGSVAKAFSLVGALSIVRFRTVVEDTRDTAFVMFSVIVGMAVGSGFFLLPIIGIAAVGGTAIILAAVQPGTASAVRAMELTVRIGLGRRVQDLLHSTLADCFEWSRMRSVTTAKQGASLECVFDVGIKSPESLDEVVTHIAKLEGVQSVSLREG